MADITVTTAIDQAGYRRGLTEMQSQARRFGQGLTKSLGFGGGANLFSKGLMLGSGMAVLSELSKGLREYIASNKEAQAIIGQWGPVWSQYRRNVGKTLFEGPSELINRTLGLGSTDAIRQVTRNAEIIARGRDIASRRMDYGAEANDAVGNRDAAEQFREIIRHRRELEDVAKITDKAVADEATKLENQLHQLRIANIGREAARRRTEEERRWREQMTAENESLRITELRTAGREREAVIRAAAAKYEQEISDINADSSLTPEQKLQRRVEVLEAQERAINAAKSGFDRAARERLFDEASNLERQAAEAGFRIQDLESQRELSRLNAPTRTLDAGLGGFAGNFFAVGDRTFQAEQERLNKEIERGNREQERLLKMIEQRLADAYAIAG